MAIKFIKRQCGDDYYFVDKIESLLPDYDLSGMSNGTLPSLPNIGLSNPIAMLFASEINGEEADCSILPYIGVELLNETERDQGNTLGSGFGTLQITQSILNNIKAMPIKQRFAIGDYISDNQITELESILDVEVGDPEVNLYATKNSRYFDIDLSISIWCSSKQHVRLLSDVVRSCIQLSKEDLTKKGVKNIIISKSNSLYNFDFSQTLYGSEIKLRYLNYVTDYLVDEDIKKVKRIELDGKFKGIGKTEFLDRNTSVGVSENPIGN